MTPRNRRRSSCASIPLLLGLILAWGSIALVLGLLYFIPRQASRLYGPSNPDLDWLDRVQYSLWLVLKTADLNQPLNPNGKEIPFQIQMGESIASIAGRLERDGLIADAQILRIYLVYSGMDRTLQAGNYTLSPALSPLAIAKKMQDATPEEVPFGVLAGWRLEEVANALPTSGLAIQPEEFISAANNSRLAPSIASDLPENASLEGFLFPGTYTFRRDISAPEMVLAMVEKFDQNVTDEMRAAYAGRGLTLFQAVTMASLVQREAILEEEQPRIASVFYNRLARGMKLDSDPTVQYSIGYNHQQKTWWTNPLSSTDLQVSSTYNTYLNTGLPPGPISSPGIGALQAVANPESTAYLYFRARCDGSQRHTFSETYEEHIQNACP